MVLGACAPAGRPGSPVEVPQVTAISSWPTATATPQPLPTLTATPDLWPTFAPASGASVTQVPEPASRLERDENLRVWLLLGTGRDAPYRGSTEAFHLLLLNPVQARAAVLSLPGSLMVYIPGNGMGRLSTAYPLGGYPLVRDALAYNLGIRPDRFVLAHPRAFLGLMQELSSIEVHNPVPLDEACGGLPSGTQLLDGNLAYCYVSYLQDQDEVSRVRRQQIVLEALFNKAIQDGFPARLPRLFEAWQGEFETDLSLPELLGQVPLALRLGDPDRLKFFMAGWDQLKSWELPDHTQTRVLLPKPGALQDLLLKALESLELASPLHPYVQTLEAQYTLALAASQTAVPQGPTPTWGGLFTPTARPSGIPTAILPPTVTFGTPSAPTAEQPYPVVPTIVVPTAYPVN